VAEVVFEDVGKVYPDGTRAVGDMDLEVGDGEFVVLVGPSGCGKTTALRMVAGLESISEGVLRIGDRVVNHVPSRDRDIAMVFQSYALYPHLSVYENIAFSLKLRGESKDERDRRVRRAAQVLGLEELLDRKPRALSGGQRQRVAMGRAIVREPQAFLMDEPLSNLDAKLRVNMRSEIARIQHDLRVTTIYVTHDQVEAMTMGDRVAVMKRGVLQQVGTPQELFGRPANLFVGGFIGSPSMNFASSRLAKTEDGFRVKIGSHDVDVPGSVREHRRGLDAYADRDVIVGIRPQDFEDAQLAGASGGSRLRVRVDLVEALGTQTLLHFDLDTPVVLTEDVKELAADAGEEVENLEQRAEQGTSHFVAEVDPKSSVASGEMADLVIDATQVHFFDPETGLGIYDR
jgi:multiple sugar transport system ATP-binding protein